MASFAQFAPLTSQIPRLVQYMQVFLCLQNIFEIIFVFEFLCLHRCCKQNIVETIIFVCKIYFKHFFVRYCSAQANLDDLNALLERDLNAFLKREILETSQGVYL